MWGGQLRDGRRDVGEAPGVIHAVPADKTDARAVYATILHPSAFLEHPAVADVGQHGRKYAGGT